MQKQQAVKPIVRVPLEEQGIEETANVLFKPNPGPQTDFLAAGEREVLYGGSAGGGKSYAMLADPLRYKDAVDRTIWRKIVDVLS